MVELEIKLPEGFLEEEVIDGVKVDRKTKEIWAVEMDLYFQLRRVCEKYGLKYFADGGTLLGAVRHKGFIPWDDDMDFAMKRDDYEKLCPWAKIISSGRVWPDELTDAAVEIFASEENNREQRRKKKEAREESNRR